MTIVEIEPKEFGRSGTTNPMVVSTSRAARHAVP
jgi:hypothetical protein